MKPVNDINFWKQRIEESERTPEHYSVYIANPVLWRRINITHEALLKEHVTGSVLDAGCGYGRYAPLFEDYTGVDFSPDFIAKAKEKYPEKHFIQADLQKLPFRDNAFDWAFCVSIKRMIIDNLGVEAWEPMEKELKRVAGKVLILEYEVPDQYEIL
jgi:SAM-dependent methyltransferase